jgi:glycosyltransferase involved in cell wall biosynthesis
MRILHIVGGLDRGGAETWLVEVMRRVNRDRYQFDFVVHSEGPFDYESDVRALGAKILLCQPHTNPVKYAGKFLRMLREHGPYDCVHSHVHHFGGLPLLLARRAGVRMRIVQSHLDTVQLDRKSSAARRLYVWMMKRAIWVAATQGIAVSRHAADSLFPRRWRGSSKWRVLELGIATEAFHRSVNRTEVRRELGIPEDAFVVGHVGRFVEQKNHSFLIDIAGELLKCTGNTRLLLVGDGPLRAAIEGKVSAMGLAANVIFCGVRVDIARLMKGAMDVFAFPSRYEGLGLVVLEAQAAGLPCLISDRVPEEAMTGAGLVCQASLEATPAEWARRLLCLSLLKSSRPTPPVLSRINSIEKSSAELLGLYGELHT